MSSDQKKVFLSYRRLKAAFLARAVFQHLTSEGYDVFMDVESLDSGEFPSLILRQIEARPHFVVALVPGSLERTVKEGDWLRREIEHAMRCERNIVPLLADGFSFDAEKRDLAVGKLPSKIEQLGHHNSVSVPADYFKAAMDKLTTRFLKKEVRIAVTPTPEADLWTVERMQKNAALATPKPEGKWTWATKEPLTAPVLSDWNEILGCSWTAVAGATGYVLEKCADRSFIAGKIVYRGDRTSYFTPVMDAGVARSAKRKRSIVSPLELAGAVHTRDRVLSRQGDRRIWLPRRPVEQRGRHQRRSMATVEVVEPDRLALSTAARAGADAVGNRLELVVDPGRGRLRPRSERRRVPDRRA